MPPDGAGSIYEPQPISDKLMGLGFPHRAGRCRPGRSSLSSPGCWDCVIRLSLGKLPVNLWQVVKRTNTPLITVGCRNTEGFMTRGWGSILPGCSENLLPRWTSILPGRRWLYVSSSQSAMSQRDWGLHTVRGGVDPGKLCFVPGVSEL